MLEVRKLKIEDRPFVLQLWREGRDSLKARGIPQWQKGSYPGEEAFDEDLRLGIGYVLVEEDHILAYSALAITPDPSYETLEGEWPFPGEAYGTTHRSAVEGKERGRGLLSILLQDLGSRAKAMGMKSMRTDTHGMNASMQHALERAGYHRCGQLVLVEGDEKGDPRLGYAKVL